MVNWKRRRLNVVSWMWSENFAQREDDTRDDKARPVAGSQKKVNDKVV